MSTTDATTHDYATGVLRHHHSLYIEDGNFVLQVENAIFKVHRSFLVKYSSVIKDMLDTPQKGDIEQANEKNPLVLTGDSAAGWTHLLESYYDGPSLFAERDVRSERLLAILPIAHKYCMEVMENGITKQLESVQNTAGYVDLMIASKIVDSKALYDKALHGLISCNPKPNLDQARRIGVDAYFAIVDATTRCRFGCGNVRMDRQCSICKNWQ